MILNWFAVLLHLQHFTMSMQTPPESFVAWEAATPPPIWMMISDYAGHLDVTVHRAAARGDVAEISRLLDTGHDIHARCSEQNTALHWAIIADEKEAVRLLLMRGADPSIRGQEGSDGRGGDDAGLLAARIERVAVMEVLVASGVGIRSEALGHAVISGNMDMIRLLVGSMSYDFTDMPRVQAHERSLPVAVHTWCLESVQYLMEQLKYDASSIANNKKSVLDLAILAVFNQEDVTDQLVETASDKDWAVGMQILRLLVAAGASVNAVDAWETRTPLHFALQVQYPPPELIDFLLSHGADVNVPNFMERTPIFMLLTRADATEEMVRRLQRLGAKLDVVDEDNNTPLHLVANPEMASLLVASGASLAAKNKYGQTPLHRVIRLGNVHVVARLVEHGADIEAKDSGGNTALLRAMSYNGQSFFYDSDVHIIDYLLQRGADIEAANTDGQTAATLIDLKGYFVNEAGKLELKAGSHEEQLQDVRVPQNLDHLW
jgi:ankyrin repeat protein